MFEPQPDHPYEYTTDPTELIVELPFIETGPPLLKILTGGEVTVVFGDEAKEDQPGLDTLFDMEERYGEERISYLYELGDELISDYYIGSPILKPYSMIGVPRIESSQLIKSSEMQLANGWRAAIDTRPEAQADEDIPATEFTAYFAERRVPVAAEGHRQHEHDLRHLDTYARAFGVETFGDFVAATAGASLGDSARERLFTGGIDQFGDGINIVWEGVSFGVSGLRGVEVGLSKLVLAEQLGIDGDGSLQERCEERFNELWSALGFNTYVNLVKGHGQATHKFDTYWSFGFRDFALEQWHEEVAKSHVAAA